MNCTDIRDRLPGFVYGELKPAEAHEVETHCTACPDCRRELAALQSVRESLNVLPAPAVRVDLPRLYADASRLQQKQMRRWRRAAVALLGAAAVLLVAFGLKLELRMEAHQLVVRWGAAPAPVTPVPETAPQIAQSPPAPAISAEEFQLMKDLIRALAADADTRDRQWQQEVASLQTRLAALQSRSQQRDLLVAALYTAQFGSHEKGEKP